MNFKEHRRNEVTSKSGLWRCQSWSKRLPSWADDTYPYLC